MGECPCWDDWLYDRGDGVKVCFECRSQKCPGCGGAGYVDGAVSPYSSSHAYPSHDTCQTCGGTGAAAPLSREQK